VQLVGFIIRNLLWCTDTWTSNLAVCCSSCITEHKGLRPLFH